MQRSMVRDLLQTIQPIHPLAMATKKQDDTKDGSPGNISWSGIGASSTNNSTNGMKSEGTSSSNKSENDEDQDDNKFTNIH